MGRTEYGSEFDWDSNALILKSDAGELPVENAKYYRSGRDALKALARAADITNASPRAEL